MESIYTLLRDRNQQLEFFPVIIKFLKERRYDDIAKETTRTSEACNRFPDHDADQPCEDHEAHEKALKKHYDMLVAGVMLIINRRMGKMHEDTIKSQNSHEEVEHESSYQIGVDKITKDGNEEMSYKAYTPWTTDDTIEELRWIEEEAMVRERESKRGNACEKPVQNFAKGGVRTIKKKAGKKLALELEREDICSLITGGKNNPVN